MRNKFLSLILAIACLGNTGNIAKSLKSKKILNKITDRKNKARSQQDSKKKPTDKSIYFKIGGPLVLVAAVASYLMFGGKKENPEIDENSSKKQDKDKKRMFIVENKVSNKKIDESSNLKTDTDESYKKIYHYDVLEQKINEVNDDKILKNKEKIVLVATGAMNPPHYSHLNNFDLAREAIEKDGNSKVLMGFISPSSDIYLKSKRIDYFDSSKRVVMCQEASNAHNEDSKKICVQEHIWECEQSGFRDFPEVVKHIQEDLDSFFGKEKIRVCYVCGSDHFNKCYGAMKSNTVSIARKGNEFTTAAINNAKNKDHVFLYKSEDMASDLSSTDIRKKIESGEPLVEFTYPSVLELALSWKDQLIKSPLKNKM